MLALQSSFIPSSRKSRKSWGSGPNWKKPERHGLWMLHMNLNWTFSNQAYPWNSSSPWELSTKFTPGFCIAAVFCILNVPHRLTCVNTWFPDDGFLLGGHGIFERWSLTKGSGSLKTDHKILKPSSASTTMRGSEESQWSAPPPSPCLPNHAQLYLELCSKINPPPSLKLYLCQGLLKATRKTMYYYT